jgi:hypothetical protein
MDFLGWYRCDRRTHDRGLGDRFLNEKDPDKRRAMFWAKVEESKRRRAADPEGWDARQRAGREELERMRRGVPVPEGTGVVYYTRAHLTANGSG